MLLGVNKAEISLRSSHAISNTLTTNLNLGLSFANYRYHIDLENEFKWKASEHVSTYLGFKYSNDGFQTSVGVKIAGFKLKVPIIFMQQPDITTEEEEVQLPKYLAIVGLFLGSSYVVRKISLYREKKKVEQWRNTEYIVIKNKQEDALLLIKDKAKLNQQR